MQKTTLAGRKWYQLWKGTDLAWLAVLSLSGITSGVDRRGRLHSGSLPSQELP